MYTYLNIVNTMQFVQKATILYSVNKTKRRSLLQVHFVHPQNMHAYL